MPEPVKVVIYGKEGCHLCDDVEAEISSLAEYRDALTVVDIAEDSALQAKYWMRVPVVTVDGEEVFEARMMDPGGSWRERLLAALKR